MDCPSSIIDPGLLGLWRIRASRRDLCLNPVLQFELTQAYIRAKQCEVPPTRNVERKVSVAWRFRWGRYPYTLKLVNDIPIGGRKWSNTLQLDYRHRIEQINEKTSRKRNGFIEPFVALQTAQRDSQTSDRVTAICWLYEVQPQFYEPLPRADCEALERAWGTREAPPQPYSPVDGAVAAVGATLGGVATDGAVRACLTVLFDTDGEKSDVRIEPVQLLVRGKLCKLEEMKYEDGAAGSTGYLCRMEFEAISNSAADSVQLRLRAWTNKDSAKMPFADAPAEDREVAMRFTEDETFEERVTTCVYQARQLPRSMLIDLLRESVIRLGDRSRKRRRLISDEDDPPEDSTPLVADEEELVCLICLSTSQDDAEKQTSDWIKLPNCQHHYHEHCLFEWLEKGGVKDGAVKCVYCFQSQVRGFGSSPGATMIMSHLSVGECPLGGHEDTPTVAIRYSILPRPRHHGDGAVRCAFLPFTTDGLKALLLLRKAFRLGYTFDEDKQSRTITWGSIPHKTTKRGPTGFPDDTYFISVDKASEKINLRLSPEDEAQVQLMLESEVLAFTGRDHVDEFIERVDTAKTAEVDHRDIGEGDEDDDDDDLEEDA